MNNQINQWGEEIIAPLPNYIYNQILDCIKKEEEAKNKAIKSLEEYNDLSALKLKMSYNFITTQKNKLIKDFIDNISSDDFSLCISLERFNLELFLPKEDKYKRESALKNLFRYKTALKTVLLNKGKITQKEFYQE